MAESGYNIPRMLDYGRSWPSCGVWHSARPNGLGGKGHLAHESPLGFDRQ
jgi:hypothetical protein